MTNPLKSLFSSSARKTAKEQAVAKAKLNDERHARKEEKKHARLEHRREVEQKIEQQKVDLVERTGQDWEKEAGPKSTLLNSQYGFAPVNEPPNSEQDQHFTRLSDISASLIGTQVTIRARLDSVKKLSSKLALLVLRQQLSTISAVVSVSFSSSTSTSSCSSTTITDAHPPVTEDFVRWVEHLSRESLVDITGTLQPPATDGGYVKSTSIHSVEVNVEKLFVVGRVTTAIPFHRASVGGTKHKLSSEEEQDKAITSLRMQLQNRVYDLRSPTNLAIFKIQSEVCKIFRSFLEDGAPNITTTTNNNINNNVSKASNSSQGGGFIEIHTAKLQGAATEGGAEVFKLDYFGRPAFLAQSPQLGKQMAIAADFERVFEIGPIFRAEDSNTHRHMTEFMGMDLEMVIENHYHECLYLIDGALKAIFSSIQTNNRAEIDLIKTLYPHEDLIFPSETVVLKYTDGVKLLHESGYTHEDGSPLADDEDFDTRTEKRLGALVKDKFNTDYYILDKFPLHVRPFYTMPDPKDSRWSNSFDIFVRGEEILSGGQRIHDSLLLEKRMKECGVDPETLGEYTEAFKYGVNPHAGGGIGLERLVMLMLQLGNLRLASLYPRDPKSFPEATYEKKKPRPVVGRNGTLPELGEMIAAYGDSTNTSYTDPRYTIWRHKETGAAIGYVPSTYNYAIIWGSPLCDPSERGKVIKAFLDYLQKEKHFKPLWLCLDVPTEEILAEKYDWRTLSCVQEARIPTENFKGAEHANTSHKIQQAKNAGVVIHQVPGHEVPEDLKKEIDEHIAEWGSSRNGVQIHTTDVRPWDDPEHRMYFYATNKEGKIVGLNILAELSQEHGEQIKWNLEFPDAPSGTSELMTSTVLKALHDEGVANLTFGVSAADHLEKARHVNGPMMTILSHAYSGVVKTGNLQNKTDFRKKFGVEHDQLFVGYPRNGLGLHAIQAIIAAVKEDKTKNTKKEAGHSNSN